MSAEPGRLSTIDRSSLARWNDTRTAFPQDLCLNELIRAQTERSPRAVAVSFDGATLSYRQLDQRAHLLAQRLVALGVGPETLVGVCLERSLEMVVSLLAILEAGAAYLPLDPSYPRDRLLFMVEDARPPVVLTAGSSAQVLLSSSQALVLRVDEEAPDSAAPVGPRLPLAFPDNPAYAIYTSGSTGKPKGVVNTHRGIVNRLQWMQQTYGLTPADRVLQKTPFSFDVSVWEFFWPLMVGARLVVARPGGHQDPAYLQEVIVGEGVTTLHFVPPMLAAFLDQPGIEQLGSIRRVMASGEALPFELEQRFFERLPHAELHNLYGPTEAAVDVSSWACRPAAGSPRSGRRIVPIGRPIANLRLHVMDRNLEPLPVGEAGELTIAGVGLARGYLRRPALTAERFVPDPLAGEGPGSRLYRTGDLARWLPEGESPGGEIEFLGRLDHQVKVRGVRIELAEIEATLLAHSEVRQAVVAAEKDPLGHTQLVAYLATATPLASTALRAHLAATLPEAMLPSRFVVLERLPLSPNGKVDRKALAALGASRNRPELGIPYVAPRTGEEELLTGIWATLLGLPRLGVEDPLLELGAHSLLVTQMISRVRDQLGARLALADFFAGPTVADLARRLAEGRKAATPDDEVGSLIAVARDGDLPTSFSQERIWFLEQLEPTLRCYQFQATLDFAGPLVLAALHGALAEIVRRHEIFRTTFPTVGGRPVERVHPPARLAMPLVDLSTISRAERGRRRERFLALEFARPFDVTRLPLVRWNVLRLAPEEHLWVHCEHHLVHDGWSLNVFLGELAALYRACREGRPSPLPELAVQFADFAAWQRRWAEGREAAAQLAYWRQQLADAPRVLELPTDRPRPRRQSFTGQVLRIELPLALAEDLRALSRRQGTSLFMTMEAAFAALLGRWSGQSRVAVGSAVANRRLRETEPLIGMLVNNVVLVHDFGGDPSVARALALTRELCLAADSHQEVPFDRVVEALEPERDASRNPLFQASFSFHDSPLDELDFSGVEARLTEALSNGSAKFDLNIIVIPRFEQGVGRTQRGNAGITVVWEYATALFDLDTMQRMSAHFVVLLAAFAADPERRLWDLPLLSEAERRQLALWGQGPEAPPAFEESLLDRISQWARLEPEALAISGPTFRLSYGELDRRARRWARRLSASGVGPEVLVAVCHERSPELVVACLAVLKAGGAFLPLDPAHPATRLKTTVADARPRVLISRRDRLAALVETAGQEAPSEGLALEELAATSGEALPELGPEPPPGALAYVIYTSGSTGQPKGVEISRASLAHLVAWHGGAYHPTRKDHMSLVASPGFDASVWEIWPALAAGASLHLPDELVRTNPAALVQWLAEERITLSFLPTPMAEAVVGELLTCRQSPPGFVLRALLTGGERLRSAPPTALVFRLVNHYGPTECTVVATAGEVTPGADRAPSIGRPIDGLGLVLVDRRGWRVPQGVGGEVCLSGVGLARGYRLRPASTAERFVPLADSQRPGQRFYRTGDLARFLPDGQLDFLGRLDSQVKIRGFRIEPREVETALCRLPEVQAAVVVARSGADGPRLVGYYVPVAADPTRELPGELLRTLRASLPEPMVPAVLVELSSLPLTASGKVDLRALPEPERAAAGESLLPAETAIEELLVEIWSEVLGRPAGALGVGDDFFSLGGHSLLAARLLARIRDALELELPLATVFDAPTIRQQGLAVEARLNLEAERVALLAEEVA